MKAVELPKPTCADQSFLVDDARVPHFLNVWHYHEEIELVHIRSGTGTSYIGDSCKRFCPGDLVLIGSNAPHLWKSDRIYFEKKGLFSESFSVHFKPTCFGQQFFEIPEMISVKKLLYNARRGIQITGQNKNRVIEALEDMKKQNNIIRIISLIHILRMIAEDAQLTFLSNYAISELQVHKSGSRLSKVYEIVMANFKSEISLASVAEKICMNPSSFSRYLKQTTNKTFTEFLNEIRISHACRLMVTNAKNISQIAYECGYNNISNFNRQFKIIKKQTPSEYMKIYKNINSV